MAAHRARSDNSHYGLNLLEEAVHLCRSLPLPVYSPYLLGVGPFVVAFLAFWMDARHNALAVQHIPLSALALALLYVWMKTCQSVFASRMRRHFTGEEGERWRFGTLLRVARAHAFWQPFALPLLPLLFVFFPLFPTALAFFQYLIILPTPGDGPAEYEQLAERAHRLARLRRRAKGSGILLLVSFGIIVCINCFAIILLLPVALRVLGDVETTLALSFGFLLNGTTLTIALVLAYLVLDPIVKAYFLLHAHYDESLTSGRDLLLDLRRALAQRAARVACVAALLFLSFAAPPAEAQQPRPPDIQEQELEQTMNEILGQPKYSWKIPRGDVVIGDAATEENPIAKWLREKLRELRKLLKDFFENEEVLVDDRRNAVDFSGTLAPLGALMRIVMYVLIGLILGMLAYFVVIKLLQMRRPDKHEAEGEAAPASPVPDLEDENVTADQLPMNEWMKLARELVEKGELRLGLRAYFLAQLAYLAEGGLILLTRFKSNFDYFHEVQRRSHVYPDVFSAFSDNLRVFEAVWYGVHPVQRAHIDRFVENLGRTEAARPQAPQAAKPFTPSTAETASSQPPPPPPVDTAEDGQPPPRR